MCQVARTAGRWVGELNGLRCDGGRFICRAAVASRASCTTVWVRNAAEGTAAFTLDRMGLAGSLEMLGLRGFDGPAERGCRGLGLKIMKYRAAQIGALLSIESAPGSGTRVGCRLENP